MGVQRLLKYILDNPATREKIHLRQFAREHRERTGKDPEILLDFTSVVNWLLSSYDYALIESGIQSPYCLLYGGVLQQYSKRILSFVQIIQSLGLKVIFCVEGSPLSGGDGACDIVREVYSSESSKKMEESANIVQICAGNREMTQVYWSLKEGVVSHLLFVLLESAREVHVMHCKGRIFNDVVSYLRWHKHVCGILSSDTSYAIASGCGLFLPSLFHLDVHQPNAILPLLEPDEDVNCEVVWSSWLANSLDITVDQLADLAILCGNDYTRVLNVKSLFLPFLGIVDAHVKGIAGWIHNQTTNLSKNAIVQEFLSNHPTYDNAVKLSYQMYIPKYFVAADVFQKTRLIEYLSRSDNFGFLSPQMLSVLSGHYCRPILVEPETLKQPHFCDVTLSIRKCIYSLMGFSRVIEFRYTICKSSLAEIPVDVVCAVRDGASQILSIRNLSTNERLSILYQCVTNPHRLEKRGGLKQLLSKALRNAKKVGKDIPSCGVVLFSSLIFMNAANTRLTPSPNIFICELEALVVTILSSLADFPSFNIPDLPSVKTVMLGSWFSHLLDQIYWLASCLGLSRDLPTPGSIFSTHRYVPFHLASLLYERIPDSSLPTSLSPKLKQVLSFYQGFWELAPVLQLRAEILMGSVPSLSKIIDIFGSVMEAVSTNERLLALAKEIENVKCWTPSDTKGNKSALDLDDSLVSISDSAVSFTGEELSSIQEYNAIEEDHFFFSQNFSPSVHDSELESEEMADVSTSNFYDGVGSIEREEELLPQVEDELPSLSKHDDGYSISSPSKGVTKMTCRSKREEFSDRASISRTNQRKRTTGQKTTPKRVPESDLPIMHHRSKILELIHNHTVVCIEGETGCGKSTKVPQFILDEALKDGSSIFCRILVTQPRRVAAIKLAERVAAERGERVGRSVGYCVGGDHHRAAETSLTYCTTGYLLQVWNLYFICIKVS